MRKLLTVLLSFITFGASAQTTQLLGGPGIKVLNRGDFQADSIFYLPRTLVTSRAPSQAGALRYQASDSTLYQWTGTQWRRISTDAITGTGAGNYLSEFTSATNIDSTSLYHTNGRFGIGTTSPQTRFQVNDEILTRRLTVDSVGGFAYNSPWRTSGVKTNFSGVTHWWGRTDVAPLYITGGLDFTFFKSRFGDSAMRDQDELWYAAYYAKHRDNDANWATNDSSYVGNYVVYSRVHQNGLRTAQHQFRFKNSSGVMTNALTIDGVDNNVTVNQRLKISTIDSSASPINYLWADATGVVRKAPLTTATVSGSGTTNYVPKFTGTTSIGISQIFDNGSNVGIGTTSPAQKLDVNGNIKIGNYIYGSANTLLMGQDGTGGVNMYFGDVANSITGSRIFLYAKDYIDLLNNGTSSMRLFGSRNIGIGTTSDVGYKVNVVGTLRTSDNSYFATSSGNVGIGTEVAPAKMTVVGTKTVALSTSADFLTLGATIDDNNTFSTAGIGGGIAFRARRNAGGTQEVYGAIDALKESTVGDDTRGALRFYTNNNITGVPTEAMRITSARNIGLGTTSPSEVLHVVGRGRFTTIDSSSSPINMLWSTATGVISKTAPPAFMVSSNATAAASWNFARDVTNSGNISRVTRTQDNAGDTTVTFHIAVYIATASFTTGSWVEVATLPTGYRPNEVVYGSLPDFVSGDVYEAQNGTDFAADAEYTGATVFRVLKDGKVQVRVATVTSSVTLSGTNNVLFPISFSFVIRPISV